MLHECAQPGFPNASMRRHRQHHRQHAPDQTQARLRAERMHHSRQGRVHEPRSVGQGPRGAVHDPRCRAQRATQARWGDRRGHGRQHRHRPGTGRERARLSHGHRDPRNAEPGEEGRAEDLRRRADRSAGGALRHQYIKASERVAAQLAQSEPRGVLWANQRDNVANRQGHVETTGPEIWRDTDGKVDGFVCAVGTGGTFGGVGTALKERSPNVKIALADPMGASIYSYYKTGVLKSEGSSITEGIGQVRITKNLEGAPCDFPYQIPDSEAIPLVFDLLEHEGLCLGGSTGINVAGAIRLARDLGPGHTIVTILADYGTRYQSKLFNPEFLRSKGLPVPAWMERRSMIKVPYEKV